jgi:hypothetical protein
VAEPTTGPVEGRSRTTGSDGGVDFDLALDRTEVLPGRLVGGAIRLSFREPRDVRGIVAALIATERWQWERTNRDANGNTTTETVTERREHQRLPVMLAAAGSYGRGDHLEFPLELPVPPLGPATFDARVSSLTWKLEVKLDVPGFDPSIEREIVVLQPTALLRAGVIDVAEFALYPSADAGSDGSKAAISLDPVPLCIGQPFGGLIAIETGRQRLQEVRLELRTKVKATVSSGLSEEITLWHGRLAGEGEFGGPAAASAFDGVLEPRWLPTVRLPHGRSDAQFHVILARAFARDTHLVRDVAICSTTEL